MEQITKGELIEIVRDKINENPDVKVEISKKAANIIVNTVFETMTEEAATGKKVAILGFGTFEPVAVEEREGHNPRTGEPCTIPAHTRIRFKASKTLTNAVNGE